MIMCTCLLHAFPPANIMESMPFDPRLFSSPYYLRRAGSPPMGAGPPQAGLTLGLPMMPPPGGRPSLGPPQAAPPSPSSALARAKKTHRVLQLPAPLRNKPTYPVPLPNDCEGLVYALDGKFDCGLEIVSDAATRILEAVTERYLQILQAQDSVTPASNPLRGLFASEGKLSSAQKHRKLQVLESSWVTSNYLVDAILRSAEKYISLLESNLAPQDDQLLSRLNTQNLEFEILTTLLDVLEKWLRIRLLAGCLERPRCSELAAKTSGQRIGKKAEAPRGSIFVTKPPAPQPRGVGRPRLLSVISIGDFVDNTSGSLELPTTRRIAPPAIFYRTVRCLLRALDMSIQTFKTAVPAAEQAAKASADEVSGADEAAAFPIEPMVSDTPVSPCPDLINRDTGKSILTDVSAWSCLRNDLFIDEEVKELFLETVREAEFLIWRETRRSTSSIEMTTSTAHTSERIKSEADLERKDITVAAPIIGLNNQIMCSTIQTLTCLLRLGDLSLIDRPSVAVSLAEYITEVWEATQSGFANCGDSDLRLPIIFEATGLHLITELLSFGRDYLTGMTPILTDDEQLRKFLSHVLSHLSSYVMLAFGRYVASELFPTVPSSVNFALQELAPKIAPFLPVEVQTCKAAVIVALVYLEDSANGTEQLKLWYGLLYSAYGAAIVLGRIRGFIRDRKYPLPDASNDIKLIEAILQRLQPQIRDKTCLLLRQKAPHLAGKIPAVQAASGSLIEMQRGDDLDSTLDSHENIYLLSAPVMSQVGQIETHCESIDVTGLKVDVFHDILYACTNGFVSIARENCAFARFLRQHSRVLREIGILSESTLLCQLVEVLESGTDLMRWETDGYVESRPSYILTKDELNS